jgi:hypothetical protein
MKMADFDYDIHYIKAEDNPVADALLRLPDDKENDGSLTLPAANTRFLRLGVYLYFLTHCTVYTMQ